MGNFLNSHNKCESDFLYDIDGIISDYSFWNDENACKNLEILYYDKLVKLNHYKIKNVALSIGIKNVQSNKLINDLNFKKKICLLIVSHYKKIINLVNHVKNTILLCQSMIHKINNGHVCQNVSTYISNSFACASNGGTWVDHDQYKKKFKEHLIKNSSDKISHDNFFKYKKKLNDNYNYYLKIIKNDIYHIKSNINELNVDDVNILEKNIILNSKNLYKIVKIYYLLLINFYY